MGWTNFIQQSKSWARQIKRDVIALWIAAGDARTPVFAKIVAGAVAAYGLSPVDLIPDFIPILGYLDDLVIVPLGILWAIRLIPTELMQEFRTRAQEVANRPTSRAGLAFIILVWIAAAVFLGWLFWISTAE